MLNVLGFYIMTQFNMFCNLWNRACILTQRCDQLQEEEAGFMHGIDL